MLKNILLSGLTFLLITACTAEDVHSNSSEEAVVGGSQSVVENFVISDNQSLDDVGCPIPDIWVGQKPDMATLKKISEETPWTYRVIGENDMITMDYVSTRINLVTDEKGVVKRSYCG